MQFFYHLLVFATLFIQCMTGAYIQNLTKVLLKRGGNEKPSSLYPNCGPEPEYMKSAENPMDCYDILQSGEKKSGVYTIWPRYLDKSLNVYCDMNTDGGGWTVIQRRGDFSRSERYFYRDWNSHKRGFGNITKEFWIGNDNINAITSQDSYKIRFDLKDVQGKTGFAEYDLFWIEDEATNYTLHIEGYKGDVGDLMSENNEMKFSTKDRDNDEWDGGSSAVEYQGAWWYKIYANANLNSLYQPGQKSLQACTWSTWTNDYIGLAGVEIKLRP